MNIEDSKAKTIYRKDGENYTTYSMGISHKKQDGSWENGYITCRFPKDTNIQNKTKIIIKNAWLDFYIKDKVTHPYIFINKFELVEDKMPQNTKTEYDDIKSDIQLTEQDLPF